MRNEQLAVNVKFRVFIKHLGRLYKLSCQNLKERECKSIKLFGLLDFSIIYLELVLFFLIKFGVVFFTIILVW